jgi:ADP-ribose pyrophosphatase
MDQYTTIKSETAYHGRAFDVHRDQVGLPGGNQAQFDIVIHTGAVTILPIDDQGNIWFVRQYRYAAGRELLELPAGTLEKDEEPEICAQREIREEIGMAARQLKKVGGFYQAPGYSTEYSYVFFASDLHSSPLQADVDEFISVVRIPAQEAYKMAEEGQIFDCKSLATLFMARPLIHQFLSA